jgi:hypothetical protein
MNAAFTPPFPVAGAGMLLVEALLAIALVSSFWVTSPEGFAQIGAILAALLLASWALAFSPGRRALASPKHASPAKRTVIFGAALGLAGLVLGFLGGPHVAGVCVWGVGAQVVVLLVGKVASAT